MLPVTNIGSLAAGQVTPHPGGHPNILRLEATNQVCLPVISSHYFKFSTHFQNTLLFQMINMLLSLYMT